MKLRIFYILTLLILLSACTSSKQKSTTFNLNLGVMSSMDYLPLAVAQKSGYFEEEGLKVTMHKFFSANDRDAAIQSGNLDGSILDYTGAAIQKAGGVDLYFTSQCDGTFEMIAGKHVNLSSNQNMKGKNFAVSRNTVIDFCTDMMLKNESIKESEIIKSEINKIPLRLEMLRNAKIDLTVLPDPFSTIAKSDGNTVVASLDDLDLHVTGIVFTKSAIANNKEAIKAFYRAYNKAISDLASKPVSDFHDILISEAGFPEALVSNVKLPNYRLATTPNANDLKAVSVWLKEKELIPADFDINSIVNEEFNPKLIN